MSRRNRHQAGVLRFNVRNRKADGNLALTSNTLDKNLGRRRTAPDASDGTSQYAGIARCEESDLRVVDTRCNGAVRLGKPMRHTSLVQIQEANYIGGGSGRGGREARSRCWCRNRTPSE